MFVALGAINLAVAVMLGAFGAHRYYVGKHGTATVILILFLSVIGIPVATIWVLVDMVMIIAGSFRDKQGFMLKRWES